MEFVLSLETKNWAKYMKQQFPTPQTSKKAVILEKEKARKRSPQLHVWRGLSDHCTGAGI